MRLMALILAGGVAVGGLGWAADGGPRLVQWTSAIAAGWLIGAFVVGALARGAARAPAAGAGTIVVGVGVYYVLFTFVSGIHGAREIAPVAIAWAAVGIAIGAVLGWAGDAWRSGRAPAIGVALLAGALAGEAILLLGEWHSPTARVVLACELILGASLPYLLARPRLTRAVLLSAAVAATVPAAEAIVRETMRAAGWAGA